MVREAADKRGPVYSISAYLVPPPRPPNSLLPPAAARTCDLEAKQIIKKKEILVICKCPNSVRLESIVEKEEKKKKSTH